MKVYAAINSVQAALAKTGIAKDQRNTQGAGYNFRGIDSVYNAIAPLLAEHGLCIIPRFIARTCEERLSRAGGALFYVTVEAEFDFVSSEDGTKHTARTFGEAMDSGDKATNKAMSAAYKYAAFQTFAIPTEGTPDADADTHEAMARREQWLLERKAEIAGAATVGELKRIAETAIAKTLENNDMDAAEQIRAAVQEKASHAKVPDVAAIIRSITSSASVEALKGHCEAAYLMLPESHHGAIMKAEITRKAELQKILPAKPQPRKQIEEFDDSDYEDRREIPNTPF